MPRHDLEEPWAIAHLRQAVRDSLMSHGEECIALAMYHVMQDQDTARRCPDCYDEVYSNNNRSDCTRCYGTSFDGGVKIAARTWGLFSGADNDETFRRDGVWGNETRQLQIENAPKLEQHDYVVRVVSWTADHRPKEISGVFITDRVETTTLRTGNAHDSFSAAGVGQRTVVDLVPSDHVIYQFPMLGRRFDRLDGKVR